jgi:hypothetical protein
MPSLLPAKYRLQAIGASGAGASGDERGVSGIEGDVAVDSEAEGVGVDVASAGEVMEMGDCSTGLAAVASVMSL